MKKNIKLVLPVAIIFALSIGITAPASAALTRSSAYIATSGASLAAKSGGIMAITVTVTAITNMIQIGSTTITVQESTNGGNTWSTVGTYQAASYSAMLSSGISYSKTPITHQGVVGRLYRAVVNCYAANSSGSDTVTCTTASVTAIT